MANSATQIYKNPELAKQLGANAGKVKPPTAYPGSNNIVPFPRSTPFPGNAPTAPIPGAGVGAPPPFPSPPPVPPPAARPPIIPPFVPPLTDPGKPAQEKAPPSNRPANPYQEPPRPNPDFPPQAPPQFNDLPIPTPENPVGQVGRWFIGYYSVVGVTPCPFCPLLGLPYWQVNKGYGSFFFLGRLSGLAIDRPIDVQRYQGGRAIIFSDDRGPGQVAGVGTGAGYWWQNVAFLGAVPLNDKGHVPGLPAPPSGVTAPPVLPPIGPAEPYTEPPPHPEVDPNNPDPDPLFPPQVWPIPTPPDEPVQPDPKEPDAPPSAPPHPEVDPNNPDPDPLFPPRPGEWPRPPSEEPLPPIPGPEPSTPEEEPDSPSWPTPAPATPTPAPPEPDEPEPDEVEEPETPSVPGVPTPEPDQPEEPEQPEQPEPDPFEVPPGEPEQPEQPDPYQDPQPDPFTPNPTVPVPWVPLPWVDPQPQPPAQPDAPPGTIPPGDPTTTPTPLDDPATTPVPDPPAVPTPQDTPSADPTTPSDPDTTPTTDTGEPPQQPPPADPNPPMPPPPPPVLPPVPGADEPPVTLPPLEPCPSHCGGDSDCMSCCSAADCQEIISRVKFIQDLLSDIETLQVPVTTCQGETSAVEIQDFRIRAMARMMQEMAGQNDQLAQRSCEVYASIPDAWDVRVTEERPQLVIQYGENIGDGTIGPSKYQITIPHYYGSPGAVPYLSGYRKGQFMGIETLRDNSKIYVNAVSAFEAERMLDEFLSLVDVNYRDNSRRSISQRKGQDLLQIPVVPVLIKFHSQGRKNTQPDWIARVQ